MNWFIYFNLFIPFIIKVLIPDGRHGTITIITDTIVLPTALMVLNIIVLVNKVSSPAKCFIFMLLGLILGDLVGYIIWGISSKNLLNPDAETIWINKSLFLYHIGFTIILFGVISLGGFIFQLILNKK